MITDEHEEVFSRKHQGTKKKEKEKNEKNRIRNIRSTLDISQTEADRV